MIVFSTFGGIEVGLQALKELGVTVTKYYTSEIDPYPIKIAMKNHPEIIHVGDISELTELEPWMEDIDLFMGGPPCQDLSGLKSDGKGLEGDKSKLFYEYLRLLKMIKPKYFFMENVVPKKKEWKTQIDNLIGVEGVEINSDRFVQQNRPRIYWTDIPYGVLPERPDWKGDFHQYRRGKFRKNQSGVCPCLLANMGTGGHNVPLYSEDKTDQIPLEHLEGFMGLPAGYTEGVSKSRRLKAIGNAWECTTIKFFFQHFLHIQKDDGRLL